MRGSNEGDKRGSSCAAALSLSLSLSLSVCLSVCLFSFLLSRESPQLGRISTYGGSYALLDRTSSRHIVLSSRLRPSSSSVVRSGNEEKSFSFRGHRSIPISLPNIIGSAQFFFPYYYFSSFSYLGAILFTLDTSPILSASPYATFFSFSPLSFSLFFYV